MYYKARNHQRALRKRVFLWLLVFGLLLLWLLWVSDVLTAKQRSHPKALVTTARTLFSRNCRTHTHKWKS